MARSGNRKRGGSSAAPAGGGPKSKARAGSRNQAGQQTKTVQAAIDKIGEVRRSQLVGTWSPGAILDLRLKSGAPVSGLLAGLEEWDAAAKSNERGLMHPQTVSDPRLQMHLGKPGFRLPPVKSKSDDGTTDILPVVRFPEWLQCPSCDRIDRHSSVSWGQAHGSAERWCLACQAAKFAQIPVVPVRFIVACPAGHLDEFPWQAWIRCRCEKPDLRHMTTGAGLAGKTITCTKCGNDGSLDGAFGKDALTRRGLSCRARRPWLADGNDATCTEEPRVLQRGASNVYWGFSVSSLTIPPFAVDIDSELGRYAQEFMAKEPSEWPAGIRFLELDKKLGKTSEELLRRLELWRSSTTPQPDEPFEFAEYNQFDRACGEPVVEGHFEAFPEVTPTEFAAQLDGIVAARRLREVRAVVGFTRINPPTGTFRDVRQRLSPLAKDQQKVSWLPAVELKGEGIFLRVARESLRKWEERGDVRDRAKTLADRVRSDLRSNTEPMPDTSPRFVLLHTLAHALIRQLSIECGYSNSALRERIYAGTSPFDMYGVLIHTGSPDSEGTLGGLVRQARVELLSATLTAGLKSQMWCSSDPLCITGAATLSSPRNGAACHACQLVPETSCTQFNLLLDRALLVGTDANPDLGFFGRLVRSL